MSFPIPKEKEKFLREEIEPLLCEVYNKLKKYNGSISCLVEIEGSSADMMSIFMPYTTFNGNASLLFTAISTLVTYAYENQSVIKTMANGVALNQAMKKDGCSIH